jgi:hypothetical protein
MKRNQLKIEDMLEMIGSEDVLGDPVHRYDLRRKLLCSSYFDLKSNEYLNRVFTFTAPLFAGAVLVVVFSVVGTSITRPEVILEADTVSSEKVVNVISPYIDNTAQNEFISFDGSDPVEYVANFVPIEAREFVLMR